MNEQDRPDEDDTELASLLRMAGAREPLPEELKARWEEHFRSELAVVQRERTQGRRRVMRRALALCTTVVAVSAGVLLYRQMPVEQLPPNIEIVHTQGNIHVTTGGETLPATAGSQLPPATELFTPKGAFITLRYGVHEVRLRENSRLELQADRLRLHRGALYAADLPSTVPGGGGLLVETEYGSIRDIGTQFTVAVEGTGTVATVRRGAIRIARDGEERLLRATAGQARRSALRPGEPLAVSQAPTEGEEWAWIHRAAAPFRIDGQSALAFLEWAAAESGRTLLFSSPAVKRRAQETILRGNARAADPRRAVEPVLAATDLRASTDAQGELLVRLAPP